MPLDHKALSELTEDDLRTLIEGRVSEGRELEYKERLPAQTDEEKIKFLAAVSSFANSRGGHLVLGVKERRDDQGQPTGEPETLCGIGEVNVATQVQRLEHMLRDGLDPVIRGVEFQAVPLSQGGQVLVLRIPRSWRAPHMIKFNKCCRFYGRGTSGKQLLYAEELRSAFLGTQEVSERVRAFRAERVGRLIAGEAPVPLEQGPLVVLHVVPLSALGVGGQVDLDLVQGHQAGPLVGMHGSALDNRYTFDGFLATEGGRREGPYEGYALVFRDGIIEAVSTQCAGKRNGGSYIFSGIFEESLIQSLDRYGALLQALGVSPPVAVMLSLMGVKGYQMGVSGWRAAVFRMPGIDRENVLTAPVLMEGLQEDAGRLLRPSLDAVWNACGYPRSPNYCEDGNWRPRN